MKTKEGSKQFAKMLYVKRGFGDEKSQLIELNRRLDQYLSRVRQLETENQHLVEEIHRLRLERGAEWAQVYHSEVCELRKRVEELTIHKCEAELERDNLAEELQKLQELWEQVRNIRLKIDQQLTLYKQDLQQAQKKQAALEQLYIQLQQECQMLEGSHEEEMIALRDQALQMPLQITMQEVLQPKLSLTEIQSFSLELSESWNEAYVYYQKKIEELESILRMSEEDRHGAEEELTIYKIQVEKLRKEYDELLTIRARLEDELLRMKAKYKLEADEYQIIIEELEAERKTVTLSITERLKDYHDLMQVKTGLSLEVAAYRALLEAESKKGAIIVTEHTFRDRPAGYVTSTLEETTRFPNRGRETFEYPIAKSKEEIRWKTQIADSGRFLTRTVPQTHVAPRYTNLGNTSSSYGSRVYETLSQERSGRWDTSLSPKYDSSPKSETRPSVLYQTVPTIAVSSHSSKETTVISKTNQQEQFKDQKPVARPRTHSKESRRDQADIRVENKQPESHSQSVFATDISKDRKSESQSVREAKQVVEDHVTMTAYENRNKYDEKVSVTETVQKETIQEPKTQELPVKKERKKRELAKKRKEEQENVSIGDMNVTVGSNAEVCETTQVKKTTVLGEKANDQPLVYEIPIKREERKQEDIEEHKAGNKSQSYVNQETFSQRNTKEPVETNQESSKEKILVDEYLKQLGQSPIFSKNETKILSEENNEDSRFMRTFVFGEKLDEKKVVREIPIQLEENKKQTYKENVDTVKSRVSENVNKINISKEHLDDDDMDKLHKDFESNEFSRAEESSSTSSETIEKKALVTDILKQLGHPSDLDDANVSYSERKEKYSDGSVKTEIYVESKTEEEIDLFDEPDLTDLWNTSSISSSKKTEAATTPAEEIHSRKIKKTILEEITGAEAEEWIGNVIHTGLQGSPGKTVNVEIVEESIGTFTYDKGECATPFHVEEAEDYYNKGKSLNTQEMSASVGTDQLQDNNQPSKSPAQVEEITEGDHVDEELNYFVSIPDDTPYVQEEEEETIRGQIYTEEESHVKYSWQDEFLQGSQGRKSLSEMLKEAAATEQTSLSYKTTSDHSDTENKQEQKETSHVQSGVIEKTNINESSVDRDDDLQTQQQKEDTHVESFGFGKETTYGLPVDSNNSYDKIGQEEQLHVIDSYGTLWDSSERYDTKEQEFPKSHVESVVIEKKIKATPEIQSTLITLLSKDIKDPQQKLRGTLDCLKGSLPDELVEELSTLAGEDQTQTSSLAVDLKKLGQTDESGTVTIVAEINVSQTLDTDNIDDLDLNTSLESEERTIHKPQAMFSEDVLLREGITAAFRNKSNETEENVAKSPATTTVHFSPKQEASFGQITTDVSRFIKHIKIDTQQHMSQEESANAQGSAASLSPTETNRSEHHIKLSPKETFYNQQIIFEGPISETLKLDVVKNTDETSEQNRSIRHIKISPTETVSTEQIIFQGPLFKTTGMGATGELSVQEKHVEHDNQATKNLVFERFQAGGQETTSHSPEFTAGTSKTVSHFKVNSGESLSTQVMFEGSIPKIHDFGRPSILNIDNSEGDGRPIEHSSATQKIHVAKQVKYQGFVSEHQAVEDYGNNSERNDQCNINTSVHHITLSPSKEHIVFEGPISSNFHISGEDKTYVEDTNRPIRHIHLGSPEGQISEHITFEGPTTESYESSDFFVSSPSGDSTESERSIKHIKLGPKEKTFTFQMDITKIATKHSEEEAAEDSEMVITSSKFEGQPELSLSSTELMDDPEVAESGYGEEEIAGVSQYAYEILPQSQNIPETSELEKTVQIQRMLHRSHVVSDEKRVAIVYLDEEEEEEEEEDDETGLRRSF